MYREYNFELADDAVLEEMGYESDEAFTWAWRYEIPIAPVKPTIREHHHESLEPERAAIGRGTRVRDASETLGYVNHMLVDHESGEVSHLIDRRGHLPYRVSLPFEMVEEVKHESVYVPATRAELESLGRYMPRADLAIKAGTQSRLADMEDVAVDHVEVDVADGVVRLDGYAADIEARRKIHHGVADIEGVVGVQDRLFTDQDLRAAALTALLLDARTELEWIDLTVEAGVATLEGTVSHRRLRLTAEDVVVQQPGGRSVNNLLNPERRCSVAIPAPAPQDQDGNHRNERHRPGRPIVKQLEKSKGQSHFALAAVELFDEGQRGFRIVHLTVNQRDRDQTQSTRPVPCFDRELVHFDLREHVFHWEGLRASLQQGNS